MRSTARSYQPIPFWVKSAEWLRRKSRK
ncbi:unnamed protein product [Ectocarpus sp. CCAP 1310/34]|nr:unnamed protein product [Ectocarpus sp. CCAP 1310/34]